MGNSVAKTQLTGYDQVPQTPPTKRRDSFCGSATSVTSSEYESTPDVVTTRHSLPCTLSYHANPMSVFDPRSPAYDFARTPLRVRKDEVAMVDDSQVAEEDITELEFETSHQFTPEKSNIAELDLMQAETLTKEDMSPILSILVHERASALVRSQVPPAPCTPPIKISKLSTRVSTHLLSPSHHSKKRYNALNENLQSSKKSLQFHQPSIVNKSVDATRSANKTKSTRSALTNISNSDVQTVF